MTTEATRTLVIEKEMAYPPEKIWRAVLHLELFGAGDGCCVYGGRGALT